MIVRGHASRVAMRRVLIDHGFEHALGSIAQAVAVASVRGGGRHLDARLERAADEAEVAVLDALVAVASSHGWKARA